MTQDAGKHISVFQLFLGKFHLQITNSLLSTLLLSSPALLSTATIDMTPCSQPSCTAKTLEAIPKRGKMLRVQQLCFLSKENASNPGYPPSQAQIPTELAFLAVSKTVTVCAFIIHSQILIIRRHSYFPCLWGKKKTKMKKYLSHQNPTEIRMYKNDILLVIWPDLWGPLQNCSLGWIQWVQPSFKCLQR